MTLHLLTSPDMSPSSVISRPRRARAYFFALALAAVFAGATTVSAHDFWVVPDAFSVAASSDLTARTVTGTRFPASESAVTPERIADARILASAASGDEPLRDFTISGKSLFIRHRPVGEGQRVIALTLAPATRRMTSDAFLSYLRLEGAAELADRYARERQTSHDSVIMRSTKSAKTLVNVGTGGPRAFRRAAGQPLELVPLGDPLAVRAGDTLAVRVLAGDRPLADAVVHAGRAARDGEAPVPDLALTTDGAGVVRLPLGSAGLWNLRTAHTAAASAPAVPPTWDLWWATLVFATADAGSTPGAGTTPSAASRVAGDDSAEVVRVVERFHSALARGDSVAILALLAPDLLVLESGEVERLAEYRGHHLPADMAFARAVPASYTQVGARAQENTAWVTTTSVARGTFNGRPIDSMGAELMVLTRNAAGDPWMIRSIHWSSRRRAQ